MNPPDDHDDNRPDDDGHGHGQAPPFDRRPAWSFQNLVDPTRGDIEHGPFGPLQPPPLGLQNPLLPRVAHQSRRAGTTRHEADITNRHRDGDEIQPYPGQQPIPGAGDGNTTNAAAAARRSRRPPIANPFGTREEIEAEDYQSPVADLFGRAWNRYREAQDRAQAQHNTARTAERTTQAASDAAAATVAADVNILGTGPPRSANAGSGIDINSAMALERWRDLNDHIRLLETTIRQRETNVRSGVNPIDQQSTRPAPLESEQMTVSVACKICGEQKIDTLLEPCMHVAICHWCSEVVRDGANRHRRHRALPPTLAGFEDNRWKCPVCRRPVTQSRRVFLA